MPSYAAFLGHNPSLSVAELAAAVPGFEPKRQIGKIALLFESTVPLSSEFSDSMGGIVMLAERLSDHTLSLADIPAALENEIKKARGKVVFSLRTIGLNPNTVKDLYRHCKDKFRKSGRPARYVGTPKKAAPSVLLHDAGLLDDSHGAELTIISLTDDDDGTSLWVGKTIAAQNVNAYSKRDMQKPVRDTTVGLLPPKLAQVLLNFGMWLALDASPQNKEMKKWKQPSLTVLDPFCGTGVIPMECLLRGWNVLASDASLKAVNGCTKNLEWLRKEEKILKKDVESTVWKHDALKPFELKTFPDVVVSETTLGTPLTGKPTLKDVSKLKTESEKLQAEFLRNAAATLPGVPLACMWPVWFHSQGSTPLEKIWDVANECGYTAVLPPHVDPWQSNRLSFLYHRPEQYVGREIVLLKPRK